MTLALIFVTGVGAAIGALYARAEIRAGFRCPYCNARVCRRHHW